MSFIQFLSIIRARWKLALGIFFGTVVLTVLISAVLPKKYTGVASVVIDVAKPDPVSAVLYSGALSPSYLATQIDVIQSDRVAYKVVRNLKLTENPTIREQWKEATDGEGSIEQWLADSFQKSLEVRPSRESNVITVTYKAPDPRFAAGLANAFVQAYLETSVELRVDPAKQYSSFFESRAKEAREALEKAQAKLSDFQKEKGIIAADERLDVETARLNELSSQLVAIQALAAESGSRQSMANGASADRMQEVLNSPLIAGMKADLARAEARLQELGSRLGEAHPQVLEAKANINELRSKMDAETRKISSGVGVANTINQQRVGELRAALEAQRSKLLQLKAVRDEGAVLQRDAENAQRAYDQVQQRLNQSSLESQATQANVSVLTQAVPPVEATSPRMLLNSIVAVFGGTLLAVGVCLVLELLDRRVRSVEDVVQALGVPVIGVVPHPAARRLFGRAAKGSQMQQRLLGQAAAGKGAQ
ncbi:chain length determinant protein EpsF [Paucibacter sp. APW11]|uniref:Chain length determinant protein EpsF n=1 Tax=Roseateles aquae TaxID=3077235 RepID=A0ABU3PFE3_9BURK|nr:chain length determinant protein EpsF [Paucibacter sp. APW11]MDT9001322.1 chain length determinant protein EpsF [Paucibacter sp. APW11]